MDPLTLLLIIVGALLLGYQYLWQPMCYFKKMGIVHKAPALLLGNMSPVVFRRINMPDFLQKMYNLFPDAKYFGFYNFMSPLIIIRDPELITSIAIKNFEHFREHPPVVDRNIDPLFGKNLFALRTDEWREMRRLLSPAFTASKMKQMFSLACDCAANFTDVIGVESSEGKSYELREIFGRYMNDVIATCSFGHAVNSMKDPDNPFHVFAREALKFRTSLSIRFMIGQNFPKLTNFFGFKLVSIKARNYFMNLIGETVKMREEQGIYRPDMIQLMMEAGNKDGKKLTIEQMTCQAFFFFFAGFDGVSRYLCLLIHEVASRPDVQARLREEIDDVLRKNDGKPTYEDIRDMPYLNAVMNEAFRLYTVVTLLDRMCVKEFELPPATPDSPPLTLKPGDVVWFPHFALHRDANYYSNPMDFYPDRFMDGNASRSPFLPFGMGPRMCLGNRFAQMVSKILLFYLIARCDFGPCEKTSIPLQFSKKLMVLLPENGYWLKFNSRKDQVV